MADKDDRLRRQTLEELTGAMLRREPSEPQIVEVEVIPEHAILPMADGSLQYKHFSLTPIGLIIHEAITEQEWAECGTILKQIETGLQWIIGDWAEYAHIHFDMPYEAIAINFGYETETLYTYNWVAKQIPTSIRNRGLTFSHHRLVAGLDEPDERAYWLERAAREGWSIAQMKAVMRAAPGVDATADMEKFRKNFSSYQKRQLHLADRVGESEREEMARKFDDLARAIRGL